MEQFFLGFIREAIGKLTNFHIFVCSFTNQRDLLSQWRGYCAQGIGFSIGFKTSLLKEVFEKKNYQLVKCIYDTDKQLKLIDALLQDSLDKIPQEEVDDSKVQEVVHPTINEFIRAFFQLAPMFKDSSFHEESEWRFISRPVPFGNGDLRYRQGLSMIIPYAEIDLQTEGNLIPVKNIVIGPTQQPELSKMSIKSLLINKGIENFSISLSKIPYREW